MFRPIDRAKAEEGRAVAPLSVSVTREAILVNNVRLDSFYHIDLSATSNRVDEIPKPRIHRRIDHKMRAILVAMIDDGMRIA